jgi:hypothetical protein
LTINGTQVVIDYPVQFEQAILRVSKKGQADVWTEVFTQSSTISGDLVVLTGGQVTDGSYKYQIEFTWPGVPEPETVSGGFKVAGGKIQSPESKGKATAISGPAPRPTC